jgi:multisubunit Na+/H+ antiporter MnhE subunit
MLQQLRGAQTRVAGWLVRWAILIALWLALVDNAKLAELVTGAIAAAISATLAGLAEAATVARPRLRASMLRHAWRPVARLPLDTLLLMAALLRVLRGRRRRGRLRAVRFRDRGGAEAAARHVLAESLGSLAPNRYVIGIDPEREYMLVHELIPSDAELDLLELG